MRSSLCCIDSKLLFRISAVLCQPEPRLNVSLTKHELCCNNTKTKNTTFTFLLVPSLSYSLRNFWAFLILLFGKVLNDAQAQPLQTAGSESPPNNVLLSSISAKYEYDYDNIALRSGAVYCDNTRQQGCVTLPFNLLSLAKPAIPHQPFRWSACLSG